jgi:hypothetical protein
LALRRPREHFVLVIGNLSHVGNFGIVGLTEQAVKARGLDQRVHPAVQRGHPQAKGLMLYRPRQLG